MQSLGVKMKSDRYDVAVLGSLLNNDILLAETLSHAGLSCVVLRDARTGAPNPATLPAELKYFSLDRVMVCENSLEFFRACRRARAVVTNSGFLTSVLRYFWFFARLFQFPPIINVPTGSDITELATERSWAGWLYRDLLRRAAFTVIPIYPHALKTLKTLRLRRFMLMRYPYFLPEHAKKPMAPAAAAGPILYFHVSNLDWGGVDSNPNRNSTKGNDRFIRAFAAALRAGVPAKCAILDRGPDRHIARKLISDLGVESAFLWRDAVSPRELHDLVASADVIVDQFDVGACGAIAMEAMALAKPVMVSLDRTCLSLIYDEHPPVLNCSTESEIYDVIMNSRDRDALRLLGIRAETWVRKNHSVECGMDEFVLRLCVAAGIPVPRSRSSTSRVDVA